jgi:hypothetical protein
MHAVAVGKEHGCTAVATVATVAVDTACDCPNTAIDADTAVL